MILPSELLDSKEKWTVGAYARDKDGTIIGSKSSKAVCWCLVGAIGRCSDYLNLDQRLDLVKTKLGGKTIIAWQDEPGRTWEDVVALLKEVGL